MSPLSTVRSMPLRISRPSTSTWRSSICSSRSAIFAPLALLRTHEHPIPFDPDLVRRDGTGCGKDAHLTGLNVEMRTVQRAFDLEVVRIEIPVAQICLLVRADVVYRVHI